GGHASDHRVGEGAVEQQDRRDGDHQPGGDHADVELVAAHEMHEAERQRALVVVGQQHHGVEELVPQDDDVEYHGGEDRRQADRQRDAPEDLQIGIAVHAGRVEQVLRDLREEAFEDVDGHRQLGGDIDQHQPGQRVVELELEQDLE